MTRNQGSQTTFDKHNKEKKKKDGGVSISLWPIHRSIRGTLQEVGVVHLIFLPKLISWPTSDSKDNVQGLNETCGSNFNADFDSSNG